MTAMTANAEVPISILTLNYDGNSYEFRFPAIASMGRMAREILSGETYPLYRPNDAAMTTLVDIGANIGAASVFFLVRQPQARLFAFEPTSSSVALLRDNLRPFAHAQVIHAGLFSRDTTMDLYRGCLDCTQNSVSANLETAELCEHITLRRASTEFERLGIGAIDLLKIDTEGCEMPILEDLIAWLPKIDQIYVEYHSEDDRLAIDALLTEHFMLCRSRCDGPHRGVNLYIARRVIEADPRTAPLKLSRPT